MRTAATSTRLRIYDDGVERDERRGIGDDHTVLRTSNEGFPRLGRAHCLSQRWRVDARRKLFMDIAHRNS